MKKTSLFYIAIILICIAFYSFFGEGLPRFWYDDIAYYKIATETSYMSLLSDIADFTHKGSYVRVTLYLITKLCLDLFGENLYLYRLMKMLALSLGICMFASLFLKEDIRKSIIMPSFLLYITSPIVFLAMIWITNLVGSLLSKVVAIFIFFHLYRSKDRGIRFYLLGVALLVVMLFGVKTREDFTLIPFVFLTFLLLKRSRSLALYSVTAVSIAIVFPYYIFSAGGIGNSFHLSNLKMFSVYLNQIAVLIPFLLYSVYIIITKKAIQMNDVMIFSLIWTVSEAVMIFLYPSDEIRYLEALLLATIFLFINFIGMFLKELSKRRYAITLLIFLLFAGYKTFENLRWDYSFRGLWGSYFLAVDKQMKYINERYNNSLCLYNNPTLLYYDWKTTNHYVNLNPDNAWGRKFEEFYRLNTQKDGKVSTELINPEKYEHIILLEESLASQVFSDVKDMNVFDGTGKTFFDYIQKLFNFKIYNCNGFNTELGDEVAYPVKKAVYILSK